jgi:hypothetical protein
MCQYHTWFRDDNIGFVIECNDCKKIQIAFGMVMIRFEEAAFHRFRQYVESKLAGLETMENIHDKTILVHTPCESMNFLFSRQELSDLHKMIEQADTEMKTQKMLHLFQ